MIMIVISFALVKFYAFAILYVLIVMQIKLVVVVVGLYLSICTGCTTAFSDRVSWRALAINDPSSFLP